MGHPTRALALAALLARSGMAADDQTLDDYFNCTDEVQPICLTNKTVKNVKEERRAFCTLKAIFGKSRALGDLGMDFWLKRGYKLDDAMKICDTKENDNTSLFSSKDTHTYFTYDAWKNYNYCNVSDAFPIDSGAGADYQLDWDPPEVNNACCATKPDGYCATCAGYGCGAGSVTDSSKLNTQCSTDGCDQATCCTAVTTCANSGYSCGAGWVTDSSKLNTQCSTDDCDDATCCTAVTCANSGYSCGAGWMTDSSKRNTQCSTDDCDDATCCTAVTCDSSGYICGAGWVDSSKLNTQCSTGDCDDATCCTAVKQDPDQDKASAPAEEDQPPASDKPAPGGGGRAERGEGGTGTVAESVNRTTSASTGISIGGVLVALLLLAILGY